LRVVAVIVIIYIYFIRLQQAKSNQFDLQLVAEPGSKYVAAAFSSNQLMEDADLYYCTETLMRSGSIQKRNNRPQVLPDIKVQYTVFDPESIRRTTLSRLGENQDHLKTLVSILTSHRQKSPKKLNTLTIQQHNSV